MTTFITVLWVTALILVIADLSWNLFNRWRNY